VIEAFGAFLIGGNFAVGLFVFMILMIINLVVVTKGAGRVSEVSARFTLDALPGKQMAIDADLAAGLMSADEAKSRRREVATEADFYGAMDGASKFVKGDAIAALLILGVNILAGFCLGMISHGLTATEAAQRYVTLAVGDALVAQVPSLLLSIAAAVIVTRVADARPGRADRPPVRQSRHMVAGGDHPGAIGAIPAMPQSVFLPASAGAGWLWWALRQRARRPEPVLEPEAPPSDPARITLDEVSDHTLVTIELGYGLVHWWTSGADRRWSPALPGCASSSARRSALSCRSSACATAWTLAPTTIASCSAGCRWAGRWCVPIACWRSMPAKRGPITAWWARRRATPALAVRRCGSRTICATRRSVKAS
jgi:flagellar biosynthesis protein FlhA